MSPKKAKAGFSLIELVIAIALGGLILVASSTLMLSLMEIWAKEQSIDKFRDHMNGLGHFLKERINESHFFVEKQLKGLVFGHPPGFSSMDSPAMLAFIIENPSPLFEPTPIGPLVCYISFEEDEGLSIIWHSLYRTSALNLPIYKRRLSEFVSGIKFHTFDAKLGEWESSEKPPSNKKEIPDFLEIELTKNEVAYSLRIPLNPELENAKSARIL